ncbi:hypothetical protein PsorP6_001992 [Peronosclerospora sorghi]|uniref:Uncharacterized protein n=1 Tax=Peronosclerospora sorghi TaxID=230839 RepID=A0ACC0WVM2_9STRA|nr:hypothetical protein PsorP6_001992 [Peronosclerospora sorghi]
MKHTTTNPCALNNVLRSVPILASSPTVESFLGAIDYLHCKQFDFPVSEAGTWLLGKSELGTVIGFDGVVIDAASVEKTQSIATIAKT